MAEDTSKAPSPGLAPVSIPTLDGAADRPPAIQPEPSTAPFPQTAQNVHHGENDTMMTSPTRPTNAAAPRAPPTPDASPRVSIVNVKPAGPVSLTSPLRTKPIHPSLPLVKVPETSAPNVNPVTLQPFTQADLAKYGYDKLRAQIFAAAGKHSSGITTTTTDGGGGGEGLTSREKEEISRLREETALALKHRIDEREAKIREIEREMEEKEKIREVERKVFRKKLAGGKDV